MKSGDRNQITEGFVGPYKGLGFCTEGHREPLKDFEKRGAVV